MKRLVYVFKVCLNTTLTCHLYVWRVTANLLSSLTLKQTLPHNGVTPEFLTHSLYKGKGQDALLLVMSSTLSSIWLIFDRPVAIILEWLDWPLFQDCFCQPTPAVWTFSDHLNYILTPKAVLFLKDKCWQVSEEKCWATQIRLCLNKVLNAAGGTSCGLHGNQLSASP